MNVKKPQTEHRLLAVSGSDLIPPEKRLYFIYKRILWFSMNITEKWRKTKWTSISYWVDTKQHKLQS